MKLYYRLWHYLFRTVVPTAAFIKVRGVDNVPRTGPCLLVGNHLSMVDIACAIGYLPRQAHFMTKAELFDQPLLSAIFTPGEPIKVHRGRADRQALRQAEAFLKRGDAIVIYAEGTRARAGEAQEARAGVVFLAQRTGAPIVPMAISGSERIFKRQFPWYQRGRIQLTFGAPFTLDEFGPITRHNRDAVAQQVMQRVAALLPPRYRGVYDATATPTTATKTSAPADDVSAR